LAKAVEAMGAGEILLNAIDNDGKGQGFDLNLVESVSAAVTIPVIASSGAGSPEHFTEVRRAVRSSLLGLVRLLLVPIGSRLPLMLLLLLAAWL
jgi:imidazole glycerol phosphate synthase subunit HisF